MPILFPTSPTLGQVFTSGGRSWVWSGATWDSPTAANTALAPYGLELIKQETGSAVSEIIVNNCFSNLYKNYQIICNVAVTGGVVNFRLRSGTTNESGSLYRVARLDVEGSSVVGLRELNTAQWGGLITPGSLAENIMSLSNPFQTGVTSGAFERIEEPAGNINLRKLMLGINSTASYHGISLILPTGTMTGTVSVYGYRLG
jgi:hypothetical protein